MTENSGHCTGYGDQNYSQEKEMQKGKMEKKKKGQNGCLRRPYKQLRKEKQRLRRKGKIYTSECRVPKNSKER